MRGKTASAVTEPFIRTARTRRTSRRILSVLAAYALVIVAGLPGIASAATPASPLWVERYDGPGNDRDIASAIGVSPDGSAVFVTGSSYRPTSDHDYATVAYDAVTGAALWATGYDGPASRLDVANALGVSHDGSVVFVTGSSEGSTGYPDYATVAYDATTGAELWARRYDGPANDYDSAHALGVRPDGSAVFVTGYSEGSTSDQDYATVAYDAATGAKLWAKRYDGPANSSDAAYALGVSTDGSVVFVTGESRGLRSVDYATVAHDAVTGVRMWTARYDGPAKDDDTATALGVSPDGSAVFVTGYSYGSTSRWDYATVGYDASTGAQLWAKGYDGPANRRDIAHALGVGPDGATLFVTGRSRSSTGGGDYATLAYDTATGAKLWAKRYDGPAGRSDVAYALGVSSDGVTLFVTGRSRRSTGGSDYATVAYDAVTGVEVWATRYDGPADRSDVAYDLGVSSDGSTLFVTGRSAGSTSDYDYATLAYAV